MNKQPIRKAPRSPEGTASVWLQVRVRPADKARWQALAASEGVSMSRWIIEKLNDERWRLPDRR